MLMWQKFRNGREAEGLRLWILIIVMGPQGTLVQTIEILKVAYNYEEQGKGVVIMTSALDTRDSVGYVSSRIA